MKMQIKKIGDNFQNMQVTLNEKMATFDYTAIKCGNGVKYGYVLSVGDFTKEEQEQAISEISKLRTSAITASLRDSEPSTQKEIFADFMKDQ